MSSNSNQVGLGRSVQKVVVHRNMRMVEPWADDIALVKMREELRFVQGRIGAICLPRPWTKDT